MMSFSKEVLEILVAVLWTSSLVANTVITSKKEIVFREKNQKREFLQVPLLAFYAR